MKYSLREGIINPRLYPVLLAPASDKKGEAIISLAELNPQPYIYMFMRWQLMAIRV
ncbi:hypothetical protein [Cellvibrio sp. KY-GH-1]|uniref:hypothetical protein n=1 Tax=Cellvibrio sp. KY-GH-1 TaxID=2303332 RepID=UPI001785A72E|nr:hypothetical protein [Cellvibrio sp. KY-GH-1]